MKKKQFKRFIAFGFTVLAVFLIASFSVSFPSFADSNSISVTFYYTKGNYSTFFDVYFYDNGTWVSFYSTNSGDAYDSSVTLSLSPGYYAVLSSFKNTSSGSRLYTSFWYNGSILPYSSSLSLPSAVPGLSFDSSINKDRDYVGPHYYFFQVIDNSTPSPEPTVAPTPTAPPTPTQDPTITSDIQFWGRVNTNANGFWQVLTQIFNGIFNNVVMRNMIVYIPLFGLIITLVVYLFTFGGRHD